MQSNIIILKLGGSIITDKRSGKPIIFTKRVQDLAQEIIRLRIPMILLHGAGSFGHPLAHEYRLAGRELSGESIFGMTRTMSSVRELGTRVADICHTKGLPVVPLQTSACVTKIKGKIIFTQYALLDAILSHHGIPILGGDVIIADRYCGSLFVRKMVAWRQ